MLFPYVCYDMTTGKIHHETKEEYSYRYFMEWLAAMNVLESGVLRFAETIEELGLTIENSVVE